MGCQILTGVLGLQGKQELGRKRIFKETRNNTSFSVHACLCPPKNWEEQVNRHTRGAGQAEAEVKSPCASHPAVGRCPERDPSEEGLL